MIIPIVHRHTVVHHQF